MRNEHRSRGAKHLPKERLPGLVTTGVGVGLVALRVRQSSKQQNHSPCTPDLGLDPACPWLFAHDNFGVPSSETSAFPRMTGKRTGRRLYEEFRLLGIGTRVFGGIGDLVGSWFRM